MHINLLNRGGNCLCWFEQQKRDDWAWTFSVCLLILIANLPLGLMVEEGKFIEINSIGVISFSPASYCYGKRHGSLWSRAVYIVFYCFLLKLEVIDIGFNINFHTNSKFRFIWRISVNFATANAIEKGEKFQPAFEINSYCLYWST